MFSKPLGIINHVSGEILIAAHFYMRKKIILHKIMEAKEKTQETY
jgi:hypothetical protein